MQERAGKQKQKAVNGEGFVRNWKAVRKNLQRGAIQGTTLRDALDFLINGY
jgi:hypothetical protein